jgi:hypothetical protein
MEDKNLKKELNQEKKEIQKIEEELTLNIAGRYYRTNTSR